MAAPALLRCDSNHNAATIRPPDVKDFILRQRRHLHPLAHRTGGGTIFPAHHHNHRTARSQGIDETLPSHRTPGPTNFGRVGVGAFRLGDGLLELYKVCLIQIDHIVSPIH